jgi:hypothetical protein
MNICEQAEAFRLLLIMGVVSKSEIIAWADELIATRDHLPEWLLDVSLAANEDDEAIVSKLDDLPCEGNRMIAAYSAIDRFAEAFRVECMPAQTAARILERWASSAKVNQDNWSEAMMPSWIAVEIGCGHASEQDVIASVKKCLAHFAAVRRAGPL